MWSGAANFMPVELSLSEPYIHNTHAHTLIKLYTSTNVIAERHRKRKTARKVKKKKHLSLLSEPNKIKKIKVCKEITVPCSGWQVCATCGRAQ